MLAHGPTLELAAALKACAQALRHGAPRDAGMVHGADGRGRARQFAVRAVPLPEGRVGLVFSDATERRRADAAEDARLREEVQRDFVSGVSHAFRTPLAIIMGCAESLQLWGLNDAKHHPLLVKTIEKNADRLVRLVEDVSKLSTLQSGRRRPSFEVVDLRRFLIEFGERQRRAAPKKRVALRVAAPAGLAAFADPARLEEALRALCAHALEATPAGGVVAVEGRAAGVWAEIRVRDSGKPIPEDQLARVFEHFSKTAKARAPQAEDTGLKLAIVKSLVESCGGRVLAERVHGKGAAFRISLPRRAVAI